MAEKVVKEPRRKKDGTLWLSNKEFKAQQKKNGKSVPPPLRRGGPKGGRANAPPKVKRAKVVKATFIAANAQTIINIPVSFVLNSVQLMWLSVWSKMFEKNWNAMPPLFGTVYILDAFQIMQTITGEAMSGTTPSVKELPVFVQTILNLLAPKNVAFRVNALKYSWSSQFVPTTGSVISVFPAGVNLEYVFGDADPSTSLVYNALIIPFLSLPPNTTDNANLQIAFGLIENLNADTKLAPTGDVKLGQKDPSAFARTYAYLGLGNSAAGSTYGECEMETNIVKSPLAAQFSLFQTTDTRASRSFHYQSGDSSFLAGMALIPGLRERDFQSKGPVIFKYIDFEEIYYFFTQWLILAWSAAMAVPDALTNNAILFTSLPMTAQTFRIVLRQALLQCFSDQGMVQFMSPKPQNGPTDNVFVPYILSAGTYSAAIFGGLKFPLLLAENMKMLKTCVLEVGTKTKVVHIPVLGNWINDTFDADPQLVAPGQFVEAGGLTSASIFMSPIGQTDISLFDGSGTASTFYNLNGTYYQTAMDYLNMLFANFGNAGGQLSTVSGDDGPGLCLLNFTRYVQTAPPQMVAAKQRKYECLLEHAERKKIQIRSTSKDGKLPKEVIRPTDMNYQNTKGLKQLRDEQLTKVNPIGSVFTDYTLNISSTYQLTQPVQAILKSFVIPTIRPDPTDALQPQTVSEWQIAYIEPNLAAYQTGGDVLAVTFRSDDLAEAANAPITSVLNGINSSDVMSVLMKFVQEGTGPVWMDILKGVVGVGLSVAQAVM